MNLPGSEPPPAPGGRVRPSGDLARPSGDLVRPVGDRSRPLDDPVRPLDDPLHARGRAVLLVIGFWTLWGVSMAASLLLSPARDVVGAPFDIVSFSLIGAYTWAALTPPLFALTRRIDLESGRRLLSYASLVALALVLAAMVSGFVPLASSLVLEEFQTGRYAGASGVWTVARYRFSHDLLAALLVFAAGVARHYFLRYQARQQEASALRAQLYESRLQVLRGQLNPHFLFNTLNAVAALVARDPKGVRRMIARLSGLLRYTLEGASEPEIPVREELEMLERYLEILEIRFQGRLETRIASEPDVGDALLPNLILQPLAENAVKHGTSRTTKEGWISVEVHREEDELICAVTDSGSGRADPGGSGARGEAGRARDEAGGARGEKDSTRGRGEASGGFGLRHIRERLAQLYGSAGHLSLMPTPEGGTVAEIRIPYHTRPARVPGDGVPAGGSPPMASLTGGSRPDAPELAAPTEAAEPDGHA